MEKEYLIQETEHKKITADLADYLAGIDTEKLTPDGLIQVEAMIVQYLVLIAKQYGATDPILVELKKIGKDVIINSKTLLTFALMQGYNPNKKRVVDNQVYTFWEYPKGSIRLEKSSGNITFIPGLILKHFDSKSLM